MQDMLSVTSRRWLGLQWSAWMPLMAAHPLALAQLPSHPGLLRIRRSDRPERLVWTGWAGDGVRTAAERLSRQVHLPVAPYDDPAVPAIAMWTERRYSGTGFEVSGALPPEGEPGGEAWAHSIVQRGGH